MTVFALVSYPLAAASLSQNKECWANNPKLEITIFCPTWSQTRWEGQGKEQYDIGNSVQVS